MPKQINVKTTGSPRAQPACAGWAAYCQIATALLAETNRLMGKKDQIDHASAH